MQTCSVLQGSLRLSNETSSQKQRYQKNRFLSMRSCLKKLLRRYSFHAALDSCKMLASQRQIRCPSRLENPQDSGGKHRLPGTAAEERLSASTRLTRDASLFLGKDPEQASMAMPKERFEQRPTEPLQTRKPCERGPQGKAHLILHNASPFPR